MSNFILSFPKGPIRFPSLGWLIIFTAHTYLGKNDLFLYLYLWNTTSRGINIKAHSGIWDTRSIWPISNSEDRYCSRHPKYNSASPRGILGHSSSICPPRLISSKFPSSPPNTTRLRLVVFGVTLEILLKYLSSPKYHSASPRGIWGDFRYFRPNTTRISNTLVRFYIIFIFIIITKIIITIKKSQNFNFILEKNLFNKKVVFLHKNNSFFGFRPKKLFLGELWPKTRKRL